jgi:hypothetical protein
MTTGPGEDLSTHELVLLALCSVAVADPTQQQQQQQQQQLPAAARPPAGELLLQLVGPHVAAARVELEGMLAGHAVVANPQQQQLPQQPSLLLTPLQQHHAQQLCGAPALGLGQALQFGSVSSSSATAAAQPAPRSPCGSGCCTPPPPAPGLAETVACLEALAAVVQGLQSSSPSARDPSRASRQAVAAVLSRSAPKMADVLSPSASGGGGSTASTGAGSSMMSMEEVSSSNGGSGGSGGRRRSSGEHQQQQQQEQQQQQQQQRQSEGGGPPSAPPTHAGRNAPRLTPKQARTAARQEREAAAAATAAARERPQGAGAAGGGGGQGQQQRGAAAAARDRRAHAVITQLLAHAWDAIRLSFQVVSEARTDWQVLLPAAAGVLEVALPAVQAQCEQPPPTVAAAGEGGAELAGLARQCAAQVLLQLLRPLPAPLLQQPCCLRLLDRALAAAAACGLLALPADAADAQDPSCSPPSPAPHQQPAWASAPTAAAAAAAAAQDAALLEQQQAVSAAAHALLQRALYEACVALLQPDRRPDPALAVAALQLAGGALRAAPHALVGGGVLELLLPATRAALSTQHLEQCSAALLWAQQLATAPFLSAAAPDGPLCASDPRPPAHWPPQLQAAAAAAAGWRRQEAGHRAAALAQIRAKLESGGDGAQLTLALLLAASGQMPPDVIMAVSTCLHSVWRAAGPAAFGGWLEAAVMRLAPDSAPWVRNSRVAKLAFIRDLTDPLNWNDLGRFKRHMKSFCTGKKAANGR